MLINRSFRKLVDVSHEQMNSRWVVFTLQVKALFIRLVGLPFEGASQNWRVFSVTFTPSQCFIFVLPLFCLCFTNVVPFDLVTEQHKIHSYHIIITHINNTFLYKCTFILVCLHVCHLCDGRHVSSSSSLLTLTVICCGCNAVLP